MWSLTRIYDFHSCHGGKGILCCSGINRVKDYLGSPSLPSLQCLEEAGTESALQSGTSAAFCGSVLELGSSFPFLFLEAVWDWSSWANGDWDPVGSSERGKLPDACLKSSRLPRLGELRASGRIAQIFREAEWVGNRLWLQKLVLMASQQPGYLGLGNPVILLHLSP